jgi:hypothetical protein
MQHKETSHHHEAFEQWYGAGRNLPKVAESCRISERTLRSWSVRFDWHGRADERDRVATQKADLTAAERTAAMLIAQQQAGELLRRRGMEALATCEITNVREAILAIEKGFALERQALALPDWVMEILNASDEKLARMLADMEGRRNAALTIKLVDTTDDTGYDPPGSQTIH